MFHKRRVKCRECGWAVEVRHFFSVAYYSSKHTKNAHPELSFFVEHDLENVDIPTHFLTPEYQSPEQIMKDIIHDSNRKN